MQKRILVIRQDRIGDTVLATALPRELKRAWPDCRVTVLVRSYTGAVLEHNPHVDEILVDDHEPATSRKTFWRMAGALRRRRFTHALLLLPQARYSYLTLFAGIPRRVGHGIILHQVVTAVRSVRTRKTRKGRSEAEYAMDLARAIGVETDDVRPEIHLSGPERERVAALRGEWGGGERRVIGLHATSGNSAPNWAPAAWAELARTLVADPRLAVVLTDDVMPAELAGIAGVVRPHGGASLRETIVGLAALDLLVSASTGPMHAAAALRVPTLSLFCPLPACEPALWGPVGNDAEFVLPSAAYCRDRCPGDPKRCVWADCPEVSPASVAAAVRERFALAGR